MEKNVTSIIIMAVVFCLIGIVLVSTLATEVGDKTQLVPVTDTVDISDTRDNNDFRAINESVVLYSVDILTQPAGKNWKTDLSDCAISSITLKNQTGAVMSNVDHYTWTTDGNGKVGTLSLKNNNSLNTSASNATTITYNYCTDDYVSGWARTVTKLVPGFFVLGILGGIVFVVMYLMRDLD